jgi:hypothetical protein
LEILDEQNRRFCRTDHDACRYLSQEKGGWHPVKGCRMVVPDAACDLEVSRLKTIMSGHVYFSFAQTT